MLQKKKKEMHLNWMKNKKIHILKFPSFMSKTTTVAYNFSMHFSETIPIQIEDKHDNNHKLLSVIQKK